MYPTHVNITFGYQIKNGILAVNKYGFQIDRVPNTARSNYLGLIILTLPQTDTHTFEMV